MKTQDMIKNREPGIMNATDRKTAKTVGYLFILATAITFVAIIFMGPLLGSSIDLGEVARNQNSIAITTMCWLILAGSVAAIGFYMYPILKKHNEGLAMGYVVFRTIEAIFIIIATVCLLAIVTLSQEFAASGTDATYYSIAVSSLMGIYDWAFKIGTLIFLGLGGISIYYVLHKAGMVPSWLSGWGLVGATLILVYGIFVIFGHDPAILALPIAVQEMVFAGWLIIKGFNKELI